MSVRLPIVASRRVAAFLVGVPVAVVTGGIAACGLLPTEAPDFEQTYLVQAVSIPLSAADLAPSHVTLTPDSSAFMVETDVALMGGRLSDLCDVCRPLHGTVVPKPGFWATPYNFISDTTPLEPLLISGGTIDLIVLNGLNFDPIRPGATARGSMTFVVTRGATELLRYRIDGVTDSLPSGSATGWSLPLPAFVFDQPLGFWVGIDSPPGDSVLIDTTRFLVIRAGPVRVTVPEITVNVAARSVSDSGDLDLSDADQDFATKIGGGGFRIDIDNPFNVGGSFQLRVVGPGVLIQKSVTVVPGGSTTNRVGLTLDEVRSLLGKTVRLYWTGNFSAPGGTLTIRPDQVATITLGVELIVHPLGG